jgi:hypothetical protein
MEEEIYGIAHFAKGSTILKNHYAISDPKRRIHQLIGNVVSSSSGQEPSMVLSTFSNKPFILVESLNTNTFDRSGIPSEIIVCSSSSSSPSSLTSSKVDNLTYVDV